MTITLKPLSHFRLHASQSAARAEVSTSALALVRWLEDFVSTVCVQLRSQEHGCACVYLQVLAWNKAMIQAFTNTIVVQSQI